MVITFKLTDEHTMKVRKVSGKFGYCKNEEYDTKYILSPYHLIVKNI